MATVLSPKAAQISYVVHRALRPAINLVCLASGGFGLYALTRPQEDCSLRPGQMVQIQQDGTILAVESSEHPSIENVAKKRGLEVGKTFGAFVRGDSGPVRARLDRIYTGTDPDYRAAFRGHSEQLVELVGRASSRILEEALETKFLPDKNAWQVIFHARVLEEDENGRQALKHLAIGMHFAVVYPSARNKEILFLTRLEVERKDAPSGAQQGANSR